MHALFVGLATGLALIVAIGAQNAFVLRQGLRRRHVGLVVAICALSDAVLITAGVAGLGTVVDRAPAVIDVVRWAGVAFLTGYGVRTLLRARRPGSLDTEGADHLGGGGGGGGGASRAALTALALTWLNPHVYLDTVLLLGSVAAQQGPDGRWWFAVGAVLGSVLWFAGLGYGARLATPLLSSPRAWQVLDVLIGLTMLALAVALALG